MDIQSTKTRHSCDSSAPQRVLDTRPSVVGAELRHNIARIDSSQDRPPADTTAAANTQGGDATVRQIIQTNARRSTVSFLGIFLRESARNSREFKQSLDKEERDMGRLKLQIRAFFDKNGRVWSEEELCNFCVSIRRGIKKNEKLLSHYDFVMADMERILKPGAEIVIVSTEQGQYALYLSEKEPQPAAAGSSTVPTSASPAEKCERSRHGLSEPQAV